MAGGGNNLFDHFDYGDNPVDFCYSNCPRVHENPKNQGQFNEPLTADSAARSEPALPEFQTDEERRIFLDMAKPCYLFIRLTRPQCRALRNYIIANSTKLSVVNASYCGIANRVFNLQLGSSEPVLSVGLIRFAKTEHAYRFVIHEHKMLQIDFLGGRYDVWNLTLSQPDRSLVPSPTNPKKLISGDNVFHFVHIQHLTLVPDGTEMTVDEKKTALAASAEVQGRLEASLDKVERHGGRPVVKAKTAARLRGLPFHSKKGEPCIAVYMTQWSASGLFWRWYESADGREFKEILAELSGSRFESFLFTVCLDFVD